MTALFMIFFPILLAGGMYFATRNAPSLAKYIAIGWFLIELLVALSLLGQLPSSGFLELGSFLPVAQFDFTLDLRVDALSVAMLVLTAGLLILVSLSAWTETNQVGFFSLLVLFSGPIFGVFMTTNVLWFFMFWELTLAPMFFLVGVWGGERRIYAAVKFFLYTHVASMFMFVGFYLLYKQTGVWDLTLIKEAALATPALIWWLMFIGFAAKLPAFPFHTWLPDAHVEAPASISVLLAGVLLKMGAYGLIRFTVELMPVTTKEYAIWMAVIGINTTLFAGILALNERHIKRMVAYSSISHMGLVLVAIGTMTYDGLSAALYEMIGHALVISPLFLIAGWLHHRTHTWYMDEMGGVMTKAPMISAIFVLAGMAALGLPGTMGFVGEMTIIVSAIKSYGWWMALIAIASLLSAGYIIWSVRRALHGEPGERVLAADFSMSTAEKIALVLFALMIVYFGIQPQGIFDLANQAFAFMGGK
jgi:NADH-quinone oxidoreductase subunit M